MEMSGIWSLQMQMVMWQQLPMLKSTEHPGRNHLSNRRPEENILLIQKIIRLYFLRKISVEVQTHRFLKSGDSVAITANGYEDLSFKFVVDQNGTISLQPDDGQGDPYELHVKIDGSFEAAIVGQNDYDGISSASVGGASGNKNSAVKVYGAITEKRNRAFRE